MAASWFRDGVAKLKGAGLLGNIELSDYDLAAQWERYAGESNANILVDLLAGHKARVLGVETLELFAGQNVTSLFFGRLEGLGSGQTVFEAVEEIWKDRTLTALRIRTRCNTVELHSLGRSDGSHWLVGTNELLAALNAIMVGGRYVVVADKVMFVDDTERHALSALKIPFDDLEPDVERVRLLEGQDHTAPMHSLLRRTELLGPNADDEIDYAHVVRNGFKPVREKTTREQLNKFGGQPWVHDNWQSPTCARGHALMRLFFQHDLDGLPVKSKRRGVVQVFLCDGEDREGSFCDGGVVVRLETDKQLRAPSRDSGAPVIELEAITDWTRFDDYPGRDYWSQLSLDSDRADEDELDSFQGLKCGGWPHWIEGRADQCERCGNIAAHLLQIPEYRDDFGGGGILQILMCENARCGGWVGCDIQYPR